MKTTYYTYTQLETTPYPGKSCQDKYEADDRAVTWNCAPTLKEDSSSYTKGLSR